MIRTDHFPNVNINPGDFRQIPVRKASKGQQTEVIRVVNQILTKKKNPDADTSAMEQEIDRQVYVLYGLTPDEIKIVEEATK